MRKENKTGSACLKNAREEGGKERTDVWSRRELIPLQPRGKQDEEQRGEATRRKDENYGERESSRWSVYSSFFFS